MSSPLARQETRASILSWWSDSNLGLKGPTINLHAAAKPLARFLYHRQALDIIRKNRYFALTPSILDIYSSYFPWDFVSWSTKAAILSELAVRISAFNARAVVDSPVFPHVAEMLESPDARTRGASCKLLGSLGRHAPTAPAILELRPCERLWSLLSDKERRVVFAAEYSLYDIAKSADGAQAVVNAKGLDYILDLLELPATRDTTLRLLECLIDSQPALAPAILTPKTCQRLLLLCRNRRQAGRVLQETGILVLLDSADLRVREQTCQLVAELAGDESTAPAICVRLVSLCDASYPTVVPAAAFALSRTARWVDGAQAIVDAKALDHVPNLLESSNSEVRSSSCRLLGNLASHGFLELSTCLKLVSLLEHSYADPVIFALEAISNWSAGAAALADIDSDMLQRLEELSSDQSLKTGVQSRSILTNIAPYKGKTRRTL
ncbi:armadillo-type protein [Mycena galopus ATCC 62051]|nr:armadillo-type protein [Mycena galopus ATCC 62051]